VCEGKRHVCVRERDICVCEGKGHVCVREITCTRAENASWE